MKRKTFLTFKIAITGISLVAAIIFKSNINELMLENIYIDKLFVKDFLYDLSIGVFSAMVLVWFIDEIENHLSIAEAQDAEKETIIQFNKVLQQYIDRYALLFYCVVTPQAERQSIGTGNQAQLRLGGIKAQEIRLANMRDLHKPMFDSEYGIATSPISAFLEIEQELRQQIISTVQNHSFVFYQDIEQALLNFILISLKGDCRRAIQYAPNAYVGRERLTEFIHHCLESDGDKYEDRLQHNRENKNNQMYPYVMLKNMMQDEHKCLIDYQEKVKAIVDSHS